MSTIDDIATPMEMMMEDTKNNNNSTEEPSITPDKAPTDAPPSPVARGIMRLSDLMSPEKKHPLLPPQSPLTSLVATNPHSPKRVSFEANPISPSPRRPSFQTLKRKSGGGGFNNHARKLTIPLNVSLADRPTKAWLAKHGQLPGQKDAVMVNTNGKRAGDTLFPMDANKRHKRWHRTVPVASVPNRPTKSWLAKVEASRAIHERLERQRNGTTPTTTNNTPCPYFESNQTLHTPNGQFFHYGDHQYP